MSKKFKLLLVLGTLLLFAATAQADLARVGPANTPSPPGHGFPFWYQDLNGLVLDVCLPDASDPGALQQTACLLGPPDPPYVFPTNFPDELFYFRAVSAPLDTTGGRRAVLVLALEAAFANGPVVPGDQVVFTRIRITAGVPVDGTYTVTHPYGTEVFTNVVSGGGNRDIVFTEDVGITNPGFFSEALNSRFGPFLQASASMGGTPNLPVDLNGAEFLSDGVTEEFVTGSPFNTNYFEICGPENAFGPGISCVSTDRFTLTGRLHDFAANPIGSPLTISRATYARDDVGSSAQVDVVATASAGIGQAAPKLTAAAPNVSPVLMNGPTALGEFYAQGIPVPAIDIPNRVTVTNSSDAPPTSVTRHIVDEVTIPEASWNPATQTLTVVATSSDKYARPSLAIDGFPDAIAAIGGISGDPASMTLTVSAVVIPSAAITVVSAAGGQGSAPVTMGVSPVFPCGVPFTQDDSAVAEQNGSPIEIGVLANDSADPCAPTTQLIPGILTPPNIGSASVNVVDGTISFTPPASTGTATFQYTLANAEGTSNVATVTVDVVPGAGGPVPAANPDTATVTAGTSSVIDVLANDSGNGGTLDPASVTVDLLSVTGGTALVNTSTGTVTFTAGATTGTFGFDYTVANTNGNVSVPAHVTVNVIAAQVVTITAAQFKTGGTPEWRIDGTATPIPNATTTITVTLVRGGVTVGTVGASAADALGVWRVRLKGAGLVTAVAGDTVVATSSIFPNPSSAPFPVSVR